MLRLIVAFGITIGVVSSASAQYSFTDLRALGFGSADLVGLSADGSIILGSNFYSPYGVPIYIQNGQSFRLPIGEHGNGIARGMAPDGTIVGGLAFGDNEGSEDGAVWRSGQLSLLEHAGGTAANANAISSDGRVIVGFASLPTHITQAARWVDGEVEPLGDLPGSNSLSQALAVSADGSVIVGSAAANTRAFRWMNGAMEALPLIDEKDIEDSTAFDISADGRRIVGRQLHFNFDSDGLLWEDGVPRNIGHLPGGDRTYPYAISGDGNLVFGDSGFGFTFRSFIWDDTYGIRDFAQLLSDAGVDLHGWRVLSHIQDVSADGRTILGYGYSGQGEYSPFLATIPEPGTLALAAVSLVMLVGRGRRSGG